MESINVRREDQILMSLVHYFVTKENYSPIYVQGVKDEIWLEKLDGPYRVIRINSNRIFNETQFEYDQYKIKDILKQIKKKTLSLKVTALNINLNEDDDVKNEGFKNIDNVKIHELNDVEKNELITDVFPDIKGNLYHDMNGLDLIFNVTKDINTKTERDNIRFEKIFNNKTPIVTYILIALCVLLFFVSYVFSKGKMDAYSLALLGANYGPLLKEGHIYRLVTYAFLHGNLLHLICNMYSLYVIGSQLEPKFGKVRFLVIYLISAVAGGLLSAAFSSAVSIGASGAIFGLLGAMLYFGFKFRLYLKDSLKTRIIPVIILNLALGFLSSGIDNACHIGGLIAGYLAAVAVGIPESSRKNDIINGFILLSIFMVFLIYLVFVR